MHSKNFRRENRSRSLELINQVINWLGLITFWKIENQNSSFILRLKSTLENDSRNMSEKRCAF